MAKPMTLNRRNKWILVGAAALILWWIDVQTIPAPSLWKAFLISLSHIYVLILAAGVIALFLEGRRPARPRAAQPPNRLKGM